VKNVHLENVVVVPENARNLETEPLHFEDEDDPLVVQDIDRVRSPGMMVEDQGRAVEEQSSRLKMSPGKLEKVIVGGFVAFGTGRLRTMSSARFATLAKF
jgi:hypothetical protein